MDTFTLINSMLPMVPEPPVPYALNQVILYGEVVSVSEHVTVEKVEVCMVVQTQEGETGFAVHLFDRRALELMAFYQSHRQLYPDDPFLVSLIGRLAHRDDETIVVGESITFHVAPDVRIWGGRLTGALLSGYAVQHREVDWSKREEDIPMRRPAFRGKVAHVARSRR